MAKNVNKKKLYVEGIGDVVSIVTLLLTLPVISAAFLNIVKNLIALIMPKNLFADSNKSKTANFVTKTMLPKIQIAIDNIDKWATSYINGLVFVLKKIPKLKTKDESELKHIAITIYYTITIGLLMKVAKLILYKKGLSGDGAALKSIRDIITNGLKLGSYDLDFDDVEKESDIMFSTKGLAPIIKEIVDFFLKQLHITEDTYNHSIEDLATVSDEALDNAYHYGRSTPGNTFGWQANLKSAEFAKRVIDAGVTDIEKISDAIHSGWNETAKKFVANPDQFSDTQKLRDNGKLDAKIEQRRKLSNVNYSSLPEEEKEKDRVVARALLNAIQTP